MENLTTAVALCAAGAEKVLSNELKKLSLSVVDSFYGKVRFKADIAGLYKALIGLRCADRVLLEAGNFPAQDFDELFEETQAVNWEDFVPKGMNLTVVKVRSKRSLLQAETSIQSVVHKAAADRLCGKYKMKRLPEGGKTCELRVHVEKDRVSLLLDLSGKPLFKRGYRLEGGAAPLRETSAAAMLLLSGWRRKFPLYDPFCGSGTILAEAAMFAWDIAPGLFRRFAIDALDFASRETEEAQRKEFRGKIDFSRLVRIAGSDQDEYSVSLAKSNLERLQALALGRGAARGAAGAAQGAASFEIKALSVKEAARPFDVSDGFIVTNPPYGKRLGDLAYAEQSYREMGGLRRSFPGWKLALITGHSGFESFFGKKADSCREISAGALPYYFFQYDVL
ncbi:MAG: class I SAM-dependent RNA methyltransferase [Spirochaetes bacterium]|nr:class I SAM-dependent RNA methyltransferase [Spirochaetota bacterium]